MKKNMMIGAALLGIFCGGLVVGQAFAPDTNVMTSAKPAEIPAIADSVYGNYLLSVIGSRSAPQTSQVAAEASTRLIYLQIKQNAEIIRLLTSLNSKK